MDNMLQRMQVEKQQENLNSDLQHFIPDAVLNKSDHSPTTVQTRRDSNNKSKISNKNKSPKNLNEKSGSRRKKSKVLVPDGQNLVLQPNQHLVLAQPGGNMQPQLVILQVNSSPQPEPYRHMMQTMSNTSIISSKKELFTSRVDLMSKDYDIPKYEEQNQLKGMFRGDPNMTQNSAIHGRSATITQDSNVYSFLAHMPQTSGKANYNKDAQNNNMQLNLPEYQALPETATRSGQMSPVVNDQTSPQLQVSVDLNRSSQFDGQQQQVQQQVVQQTNSKQSEAKQQMYKTIASQRQKVKKNEQQRSIKKKTSLRGLKKPNISSIRKESNLGMQTTTRFNPSLRSVDFQRGAHGPQTNLAYIAPKLTQSKGKLVVLTHPSHLLSSPKNFMMSQQDAKQAFISQRMKAQIGVNQMLSQQAIAQKMQFMPQSPVTNQPLHQTPSGYLANQNNMVYNQNSSPWQQSSNQNLSSIKRSNRQQMAMHQPLRNRTQIDSTSQGAGKNNSGPVDQQHQMQKQYNEIFQKLTEQQKQLRRRDLSMPPAQQSYINSTVNQRLIEPEPIEENNQWLAIDRDQGTRFLDSKKHSHFAVIPGISSADSTNTLRENTNDTALNNTSAQRVEESVQDGGNNLQSDVIRLNFGQIIENEKRFKQENMDDSNVIGRKSAMHGELQSRSVSQSSIQQNSVDLQTFAQDQIVPDDTISGQSSLEKLKQGPIYKNLSKTLSPMKQQQSEATLGRNDSVDNSQTNLQSRNISKDAIPNQNSSPSKLQEKAITGKKQQASMYMTQANFPAAENSKSKLRDFKSPKKIKIKLSSQIDQSNFDQTMYNSNISGAGNTAIGFNQSQRQPAVNGAIKIQHSPSFKMIYTSGPNDFNHMHHKTQQRVVEARNIQLENAAYSTIQQDAWQKNHTFQNSNKLNMNQLISSNGSPQMLTQKMSSNLLELANQVNNSYDADALSSMMASSYPNPNKTRNMQAAFATVRVPNNMNSTLRGGKMSPFQQLTNEETRKVKLHQKRSLMQLPKLPQTVINSMNNSIDSMENDILSQTLMQQTNAMMLSRRHNTIGISPTQKIKGGKFVSKSSDVRQRQLERVQKDKSQARIQMHMQRFEKLYNPNGNLRAKGNLSPTQALINFGQTRTQLLQKGPHQRSNIMMHSPQPSTYVQMAKPSINLQEMQMNNLMNKIVETGYQSQNSRSLLHQASQSDAFAYGAAMNQSGGAGMNHTFQLASSQNAPQGFHI